MSRTIDHNLVVFLGLKAFGSLFAIFLIIVGGWLTDRDQDEKDPNDNTHDYENLSDDEESIPFYLQFSVQDFSRVLTRKDAHVNAFKVFVRVSMIGWILLILTFFFSHERWTAYENLNGMIYSSMAVCLLLLIFHIFVFPKAIETYQVFRYRYFLFGFLIIAYVGLGFLIQINNKYAPIWLAPIGGLSIALSTIVLWLERQRGYDVDKSRFMKDPAPPEPHHRHVPASLFSLGPILHVFGWCAFWLALNATRAFPDFGFFPIYLNSGSRLAWIGCAVLLLTLWMVGYALDETPLSEADVAPRNREKHALGLLGKFIGNPFHVCLLIMTGWLILGASVLFPFVEGFTPWFLSTLCLIQGAVWCAFYYVCFAIHDDESSESDVEKAEISRQEKKVVKNKKFMCWARTALILALVWYFSTMFVIQSISANLLGAFGIFFLLAGMRGLQRDRRRGERLLSRSQSEMKETLPPLVAVYSVGALLMPLGTCCLAYAISVPR